MEDLAHRPKRRRESSRLPSPFLAVAAPPEKRLRVTSPQSVPDNHGDDDVCFISKAEFEQTKRKQPKREDSSPEVDIPSIVIDAIAAARQLCAFAQQIPISKSPDDAEAEAAADKCLRLQTCLHDIFKRRKIELAASIRDEVVGANKGLRNALDKYDDAISMALSSSEEAHEHENTEAQQDHAMMSDDDSMSMDISSSEEAQQSDIEPQQDAATMSDHDRQGSISPGAGQPNAPHDDACECRACRTAWSLHYNYVHVEDPYGAVPRANRVGFENAFGRVFKDQMLLWEALRGPDLNVITHRGNGHRQGNRRLAILGDAAMRLVYLDLWFSEDDRNWGIINDDFTKSFNKVLSNKALREFFDRLNLKKFMTLSNGFKLSDGSKGDTVEAFFGLIYQEGGLGEVLREMRRHFLRGRSSRELEGFPDPRPAQPTYFV